jgi:integrase
VKRFATEKKEKHPASWIWVTEFMSASSPHLGALACFMFLTGARISESLSLGWNEVDLSLQRALIQQTKTGTERLAHLPTELIAALASIPGSREGRVFGYSSRQSCDRSWRRACVRAGIEVLSFHSCRHGFATELLRKGVDVVTVAKLGGWRSPAVVLAHYGHSLNDLTLTDRLIETPTDKARTA